MIVPSYTDERILQELMDDWPGVKRKAKKLAEKLLASLPKGRIGLDTEQGAGMQVYHRSKNGNRWHVSVYCHNGSTKWWSVCYCEVESVVGSRSYFYLRGLNTPHPYYVEVWGHAVRRLRERYKIKDQEHFFDDMPASKFLDWAVFDRHECGIYFRAGKRRNGKFVPFTDRDGNTPGIALMKNSMFYARRTPAGNFIFRTFITPVAEEGSLKKDFIWLLFGIWRSHNMPKEHDNLQDSSRFLARIAQTVPRVAHHLDDYSEKVVPLYP